EIRGTEAFGRPDGKPPRKKSLRVRDVAAALPAPQSAASRLGPALAVGALFIALGGVWCTCKLVASLRERRAEGAAVQAIAAPAVDVPAADAARDRFEGPMPLSGGSAVESAVSVRYNVFVGVILGRS
ncbi:MAG: hypothetical protein II622_06605, partial [Thermoguttaceae bacterium]|nr:hypothetical protein [Thermoguttaceae bacterium]